MQTEFRDRELHLLYDTMYVNSIYVPTTYYLNGGFSVVDPIITNPSKFEPLQHQTSMA